MGDLNNNQICTYSNILNDHDPLQVGCLMGEFPLVSVIVPVFNGAEYIGGCLQSILQQNYPRIEIIVVDDASTDNSANILTGFGDRITVITHSRNKGISAARNSGTKICSGKYIAYLDMDDRWHPSKLSLTIKSLAENPDHLVVFSDFLRFEYSDGQFLPLSNSQINSFFYTHLKGHKFKDIKAHRITRNAIFRLLLEGYPIYPSTITVHRSMINYVGAWCEDVAVPKGVEDFEYTLRCARKTDFLYLDLNLTYIGRHSNNVSSDMIIQLQNNLIVIDYHLKNISYTDDEIYTINYYKGRRLCGLGWNMIARKNYKSAVVYYGRAMFISQVFMHAFPRWIYSLLKWMLSVLLGNRLGREL